MGMDARMDYAHGLTSLSLIASSAKDGPVGPRRPHRSGRTAPRPQGPPMTFRARLATVEDRCWQCRSKVRGIVGILVDPQLTQDGTGFVPFHVVAGDLARTLDTRALAARRIGEVKHRDSPGVEGGYISNGCIECDALLGRFALDDLLHEHLADGGNYRQLDIGIAVELSVGAETRLRAQG